MRPNQYTGACCYCAKLVMAHQGYLVQFGSRLSPAHKSCWEELYGKKGKEKS